jgi:hypothetical protein
MVGITAGGLGLKSLETYAGIHFMDETSEPDPGMDIHIATGNYSVGETRRKTFTRSGDHYWWSKSDPTDTYLLLEPGGLGNYAPNDFMHFSAYNKGSLQWRNILFNRGTTATGYGSGFVGIGGDQGFSEPVSGPVNLSTGQYYLCLTNCTVTYTPFLGFGYSALLNAGDFFTSLGGFLDTTTLNAGTVSAANPMTKLHVAGATTIGTRKDALYTFVGNNSLTVGNNHIAQGVRSIILGGTGHTLTGQDSVIMGYAGVPVTMSDANTNLLATYTYVSTKAPSPTALGVLYEEGDTGFGVPYYLTASAPILNCASPVQTSGFGIYPQVGRLARVLTLTGKTDTAQNQAVPVTLEWHIENSAALKRAIGMINGHYYEVAGSSPANQRGKLGFAVNKGGNMYEYCNISPTGLQFTPQNFGNKAKILVSPATDSAAPTGHTLGIAAGDGHAGVAGTGGFLVLDAGLGTLGNSNGQVVIGVFNAAPRIQLGTTGTVVQAPHVVRADVDFTTGTDTPGWVTVVPINNDLVYYDPNANNGNWGLTGTNNYVKYKIIGKTCHMHVHTNGNFSDGNLPYTHAQGWILPAGIVPKYEVGLNQTICNGFGRISGSSVRTCIVTIINPLGAGQWRRGPGSTPFNANAIVCEDINGASLAAGNYSFYYSLTFELA